MGESPQEKDLEKTHDTHINGKRRCVKMHTFIILRTKPRLSQAGALLLPKDSVSLDIRISL